MPESMSVERRKMLLLLGAKLELTPAAQGMRGAVARAQELQKRNSKLDHPAAIRQSGEPVDPPPHHAEEIWNDTAGKVDASSPASAPAAPSPGVGSVLKARKAVGEDDRGRTRRQRYPLWAAARPATRFKASAAGFIPSILDRSLIDEIITIGNETAFATARKSARMEGIPCGISSGAAIAAALEVGVRKVGPARRWCHHSVLRRALPLDCALRWALVGRFVGVDAPQPIARHVAVEAARGLISHHSPSQPTSCACSPGEA